MHRAFILFLFTINFLSNSSNLYSQKNLYPIKGFVREEHDHSPIIGVNILINELKFGTTTNEKGYFSFHKIPAGEYTLRFSFVGHKTVIKQITVPSEESENLIVEMIETPLNLGEVVITGNPFLTDPTRLTQSTILISNLDLQIKRNSTIAQTLEFQPGVYVRSNGIATSRPIIRGFSNNRVLILEDGLRMGDLSNSSDDHGVTSDGSTAERIEILRGPASLLYGSNALGGVINVITDAIPSTIPQGFNGDIYVEGSSVNEQYLGNLHLNYGINNFSFHSNALKRKSRDYRIPTGEKVFNSDLESQEAEVGASYHPAWGVVGLSYSFNQFKYGIPTTPDKEPIALEMSKHQFRYLTEIKFEDSFLKVLSLKAGYQDYHHEEVLKNNSNFSDEHGSKFALNTFSADLSIKHKPLMKELNGIFGIWSLIQKYRVEGEEAFTPNADYNSFAIYFMEQLKFNKLDFQIGMRYELNEIKIPDAFLSDSNLAKEEKSIETFSGSIGLSYELGRHFTFFGNFAGAYRSPTIEEFASFAVHEATASFDIGNRNLTKENNLGFDFGIRLFNSFFSIELSGYYNLLKNYIYKEPTGKFFSRETIGGNVIGFNDTSGFPVYQYTQNDAIFFGVETKAQIEITSALSTTAIFDYVRAYEKLSKNNLPQIPPTRFSFETRYTRHSYWFGFIFKLIGDQTRISPFESETKGYGLFDVYVGVKFFSGNSAHIFNLRVDNLFDQSYRDHLSAIKEFALMPGRNISLSYKFLF